MCVLARMLMLIRLIQILVLNLILEIELRTVRALPECVRFTETPSLAFIDYSNASAM